MELLQKEKELTRTRDALIKERQSLPIVEVTKAYTLTTIDDATGQEKQATLTDLFQGRDQLITYHFMFDPEWNAGCASCTLLGDTMTADNIKHLNSRGVSFVVVSRAPIDKLQAYKKRLGFKFPWYSSYGTSFNPDFGVTLLEDDDKATYNFYTKDQLKEKKMPWFTRGEQPGHSCFILGNSAKGIGEDGKMYHTYSSYARGGETVMPVLNWLDMTKLGRRDDISTADGVGFRRHDEYSSDELKGIWKKE